MAQLIDAIRALRRDARGVLFIEFAYSLPVLLFAVLGLIELVNFGLVKQQLSQLALQVADNASRMGAQDVLRSKPVSEGEINDTLLGGELQGVNIDVARQGRIIISSLEQRPAPNGSFQMIRWQRCSGALVYASHYGAQGDGATSNSLTGMGPPEGRISSSMNIPVMFVEVGYRYRPMFFNWVMREQTLSEIAALSVRDDRAAADPTNNGAVPIASCSGTPTAMSESAGT